MNRFYSALAVLLTAAIAAPPAMAQQSTPQPSAAPAQASPQASPQPSPAPSPQSNGNRNANNGKHLGQVKKLRQGSLTPAQVKFALTHQSTEIARLRGMKQVKFENLRVYRLPAALRRSMHTHAAVSALAYEPFSLSDALAQTSSPLLNILANINVSDALNNALNGNNVSLSLSDVLNSNNIGIGQVVGVYIGGGGIITTII
jgi:hypothetical protein